MNETFSEALKTEFINNLIWNTFINSIFSVFFTLTGLLLFSLGVFFYFKYLKKEDIDKELTKGEKILHIFISTVIYLFINCITLYLLLYIGLKFEIKILLQLRDIILPIISILGYYFTLNFLLKRKLIDKEKIKKIASNTTGGTFGIIILIGITFGIFAVIGIF